MRSSEHTPRIAASFLFGGLVGQANTRSAGIGGAIGKVALFPAPDGHFFSTRFYICFDSNCWRCIGRGTSQKTRCELLLAP